MTCLFSDAGKEYYMMTKKKALFQVIFLLAVFGLTVYGVFHGEDLGEMMEAIHSASIGWLIPGVFLVIFFICPLESI